MTENNTQLLMYESADGITKIEVKMQDETVWLSIDQMAELFGRDKSTISRHIKNVFEEGELEQNLVVANFATTTKHGAMPDKTQTHEVTYYNLDMIISVGYRVNSLRGTQFRQWATKRLKEYIIKGFAMDDDRLKELGGGDYWHELLDRIRDIRSSEKVMYRQVLDLYATSVDYNPKSVESIAFFKMVQNKFHYAAHGNTAAEVVYNRADSEKPFMGLTSFSGDFPTKKDVVTAKNYLDENELKTLNNLVSAYFDLAEIAAMDHKPMHMSDYVEQLDNVIQTCEIATTDFVMNEIQRPKQLEKVNAFVHSRKLEIAKFDFFELAEVNSIFENNNNNASFTVCSVWYYAKKTNGRLLTGDAKLKKSAAEDSVKVSGILYIFDNLVEYGIVDKKQCAKKLEKLTQINTRLPKGECEKRIVEWEK